ncbi:hypothetical protein [Microbacterium sp. NPDC087868]|uniref:hypothetical protein n=1 Tax=Microbacterium sp. NPDC087868 TaxID=3364195 RepID=UPI00384EE07C
MDKGVGTGIDDDRDRAVHEWDSEGILEVEHIDGVRNFSSEGGIVHDKPRGNGPEVTERGFATDGHNAQRSSLPYYRVNPGQLLLSPVWAASHPWEAPAVGYLDTDSQSFEQSVVDVAHAAENPRSGE